MLSLIRRIIYRMLDFYRRSWPVFLTLALGLFIAAFNVEPAILLFILAGIFFVVSIQMIILDIKACREKDRYSPKYKM